MRYYCGMCHVVPSMLCALFRRPHPKIVVSRRFGIQPKLRGLHVERT